jgi:acyl-CoA synthetase (AMP-forming)/AMP-acid ligase II
MNVADYLLDVGRDDDVAVITARTSHTYRELRSVTHRIARRLLAIGVAPGDRVGLLSANSLFWVAAYLATIKIGAISVPFSTALTPEEFQRSERFVMCRALCVQQRYEVWLRSDLPSLVDADVLSADDADALSQVESASVDLDQDAAFMLTSGTTSQPKVVRVSHGNIQANTASIISYLGLTREDRMMVVLPFFYCFGTSLLHTHLRVGGSLVLNNQFVYPETVIDMIERHRCTGLAGVPSTYQTLLRSTSFPRRNLASLKKVQQSGGTLPKVLIEELMEALPDARIFIMYGQTEATARLSHLPPHLLPAKIGSVGKGIPGVELRVVGDDGQGVKPGEVGEIVAQGANVTLGYYRAPELTAQRYIDGALRTGDLATVDEEGFIYIVDRLSDFIKPYGHRVSSQQVEAYVMELSDVVSAAAIGVPDLVRGEAIQVYVVLRKGADLTVAEIFAHCKRRMATHMVPRDVILVDQLPMNERGKIRKSVLRARAGSGSSV